MSEWIHVLPNNDWIDHKDVGFDCICEPKVDWNNKIIVHNSADGREENEMDVLET